MSEKTGFLRAFFGTCSGRDIFYTLRRHSWSRTVWHLFLLSLICGVITGNVQSCRLEGPLEAARLSFTEAFGETLYFDPQNRTVSGGCVAPVSDPRKPREMALPRLGRLYYTGTSSEVPRSVGRITAPVIIWRPGRFFVVQPVEAGYMILWQDPGTGRMLRKEGGIDAVEQLFRETPAELPAGLESLGREKTGTLFETAGAVIGFFLCAAATARNFLLVWLYTGIFMVMYRLLNGSGGRLRFLTLKEMWKCGIYASFPPMAVASLFPALDLPFLSYETVFMMGLLIYWMAVTARLERTPEDNKEIGK